MAPSGRDNGNGKPSNVIDLFDRKASTNIERYAESIPYLQAGDIVTELLTDRNNRVVIGLLIMLDNKTFAEFSLRYSRTGETGLSGFGESVVKTDDSVAVPIIVIEMEITVGRETDSRAFYAPVFVANVASSGQLGLLKRAARDGCEVLISFVSERGVLFDESFLLDGEIVDEIVRDGIGGVVELYEEKKWSEDDELDLMDQLMSDEYDDDEYEDEYEDDDE